MKIRIKTKEELGGRPRSWNCNGEMDYLFGKVVEAQIDSVGNAFVDAWTVFKGEFEVIQTDATWIALKSLSCASIYEEYPCSDEFANYTREVSALSYGFFESPMAEEIFNLFDTYPAWEEWLLRKGFIEKKASLPPPPVRVGDIFNPFPVFKRDYQIIRTGRDTACLYCVRPAMKFADFRPVKIHDMAVITLEEFKALLGRQASNWKKIYKTRKAYSDI